MLFPNLLYISIYIISYSICLYTSFDNAYKFIYHTYKYIDELQELSENKQYPKISSWVKTFTFEGWKDSENNNTREFIINDVDLLNDIESGLVKGFNLNLMSLSQCEYAVFSNMEVVIEYKNNN